MPLAILHPDKDFNSALEMSLKKQRPKSNELMINMLCGYEKQFLSKMMLSILPEMIAQNSEMTIKFLSSNIYVSPMMEAA